MSRPHTPKDDLRIESLRTEYVEIQKRGEPARFWLDELLSFPGWSIREYCKGFQPNPHTDSVCRIVETWMRECDMWIPGMQGVLDASGWMFPQAGIDRLTMQSKLMSFDWYLNDTIGRDRARFSRPDEVSAIRRMYIEGISSPDFFIQGQQSLKMEGLGRLLVEIRQQSSDDWYTAFADQLRDQVELTHRDRNARGLGTVSSIPEYCEERSRTAGMTFTVHFVEFVLGLELPQFNSTGSAVERKILDLRILCELIVSLGNDIASFEREVIDAATDSNLVALMALNFPRLSLEDCLRESGNVLGDHMRKYVRIQEELHSQLTKVPTSSGPLLRRYLKGMDDLTKSVWTWQVETSRYKRPNSIFYELRG